MLLTIFTPTYNRANTLGRLYQSLSRQTVADFEWIIVDDGSTDDTEQLVAGWISEGLVPIKYYYQPNAGKPMAHNRGVQEASGELFCCVDSDDYLKRDAVEQITYAWRGLSDDTVIGLLAFRCDTLGNPITIIHDSVCRSTLRAAYKRHGMHGDTMLIYRTSIIRKYEFPSIEGERFIPEGYLYNKLDREGELQILPDCIYICDYQDDGYTANVSKLIFDNYKSYILHLNTRIEEVDTPLEQFLDSIRYDAIAIAHSMSGIVFNAANRPLALLALLPGYLLYWYRYRVFNQTAYNKQ